MDLLTPTGDEPDDLPSLVPSPSDPFALVLSRPVRVKTVRLAADPADADALETARDTLRRAQVAADRPNATPDTADAVDDATAALARLEASTEMITFTVRAIGANAVDAIMARCPASDAEQRAHRAGGGEGRLQWSAKTYPPALVAATLLTVELPDGTLIDSMTEAQVQSLWDSAAYTIGDLGELFGAALIVNQRGSVVPGKA